MGDSNIETPREGSTNKDTTPLADNTNIPNIFREPDAEQQALLAVLDLDTSHIRAYIAVVENPHSKVNKIADVLERHRRYVSKSLRTLYDYGLVEREQETFDTGGYGYVYWPVSPETIQTYFQRQLRDWVIDAENELGKIDRRIESTDGSICDSHMGS